MPNSILLMSFGASLVLMVADEVPNFNVEASCKAVEGFGLAITHTLEVVCSGRKRREGRTRAEMDDVPAGGAQPLRRETMVGDPSYVDVLTCLQMAQDADAMKTPLLGASKIKRGAKSGSPSHR